ncbi:MAG TPA: hypothetical protein VNL91_10945 [Thermoanaerobaculia bacterium]|nr:hypothetical protein [Thermoanaerobaculia bacterium]
MKISTSLAPVGLQVRDGLLDAPLGHRSDQPPDGGGVEVALLAHLGADLAMRDLPVDGESLPAEHRLQSGKGFRDGCATARGRAPRPSDELRDDRWIDLADGASADRSESWTDQILADVVVVPVGLRVDGTVALEALGVRQPLTAQLVDVDVALRLEPEVPELDIVVRRVVCGAKGLGVGLQASDERHHLPVTSSLADEIVAAIVRSETVLEPQAFGYRHQKISLWSHTPFARMAIAMARPTSAATVAHSDSPRRIARIV